MFLSSLCYSVVEEKPFMVSFMKMIREINEKKKRQSILELFTWEKEVNYVVWSKHHPKLRELNFSIRESALKPRTLWHDQSVTLQIFIASTEDLTHL